MAFLIARYFARERILKMVEGNKKFLAIDKAIGENGFKVVTLLRLSPLLPFSLGNYLYGLTSVKFLPYVLGRLVSAPTSLYYFGILRESNRNNEVHIPAHRKTNLAVLNDLLTYSFICMIHDAV